jgi:phage-related protein
VSNFVSNGVQWGKNLVKGIADGILSGVKWVKDAVASVADGIKSFLGFSSPTEEGPGSEAGQWIPNLIDMLKKGLDAGIPELNASLSAAMNPDISATTALAVPGAGMGRSVNITITGNYIRDDDDIDEIAGKLVRKLKLLGIG